MPASLLKEPRPKSFSSRLLPEWRYRGTFSQMEIATEALTQAVAFPVSPLGRALYPVEEKGSEAWRLGGGPRCLCLSFPTQETHKRAPRNSSGPTAVPAAGMGRMTTLSGAGLSPGSQAWQDSRVQVVVWLGGCIR